MNIEEIVDVAIKKTPEHLNGILIPHRLTRAFLDAVNQAIHDREQHEIWRNRCFDSYHESDQMHRAWIGAMLQGVAGGEDGYRRRLAIVEDPL